LILIPRIFGLSSYNMHVLIMVLFFAYLSTCWNLLGGFTGQHSVGHSAFVGLGAYTSTFLFLRIGLNPWLGMLSGGLIAALAGLFIGYLSFRYRLRGLYFVLVTIAFAEILTIVFANIRFLGGASGLVVPLKEGGLWLFQFKTKSPYYFIILTMLLFMVLLTFWVSRSRFGYYLMAIRENEEAARAVGVPVMRYKLLATVVSAFFSAFGGTFYAQYTYFIDPPTVLGFNLSIEILIYPIVGGVGTVLGPLLGASLLYPLAEAIRTLLGAKTTGIHMMVYGAILVFTMIFAPRGIVGLFQDFHSFRSRRKK
jgi:branched-chain amino acid transport system permease protein